MSTGFLTRFKGKIKAAVIYLDSVAGKGLQLNAGGTYVQAALVWTNAGSPTNGTSGTLAGYANPGDLLVDTSGLALYQNTNTLLSPTWTIIESSGGAGAFTTLTASSTVTLSPASHNVVLSPTGTGVVTVNPATAGTINNVSLGATTPAPVTATALGATGAVTLSPANANVVASPTGTGVVTLNPATLGTVANMTVGGTTPAAVTTSALHVDNGTKTATASSGAATLNKMAGVITTESLTTAGLADYTLTLTNSDIAATDQVFVSIGNGTNSAGDPVQGAVTPGAGSVVIVVRNAHATNALNGTLKIAFMVLKN